eukprot:1161596-Pelagomonas_calceolata.AAC.6
MQRGVTIDNMLPNFSGPDRAFRVPPCAYDGERKREHFKLSCGNGDHGIITKGIITQGINHSSITRITRGIMASSLKASHEYVLHLQMAARGARVLPSQARMGSITLHK